MRYNLIWMVILTAVTGTAAEPRASLEKPTIQDLLSACDSTDPETHKHECDSKFAGVYLADMMYAADYPEGRAETLCIPVGSNTEEIDRAQVTFQKRMLAWLRSHPETLPQSVFDGTWAASLAIYKCKRGEPARW